MMIYFANATANVCKINKKNLFVKRIFNNSIDSGKISSIHFPALNTRVIRLRSAFIVKYYHENAR
jgi:hypothetical protein